MALRKRNPNAPRYALTVKEIIPGASVVVVRGERDQSLIGIVSKPYAKKVKIVDSGRQKTVKELYAKGRVNARHFNPLMASGEQPGPIKEMSLADMGVCPDRQGNWSAIYAVYPRDSF